MFRATLGENHKIDPTSAACQTAVALLHQSGNRYDMSFGGQSQPVIYHEYLDCFNETEKAWFVGALNASLPQVRWLIGCHRSLTVDILDKNERCLLSNAA